MKNLLLYISIFYITIKINAQDKSSFSAYRPVELENAIIYEANIRQYSNKGNFDEFTKDLPKLKKLGVKILWLMPIHEVGVKNRKATGNQSIEQIPDKERSKYYGSHYSVKDYRSITKNYGTKADFKKLVKTAHSNGMYVILDWVANHTAWDHPWVLSKPDFYTKKEGKMVSPFDWTDVVELNYDNPKLRKAMIEDMKYWIKEFDIDGFRCDVAMEVPKDFWEQAKKELNKPKKILMLMEAEQKDLMEKAFDIQYGWEIHHIFNKIYKGEKSVKDFDNYIEKISKEYQKDDITMNFTSNHDENSWNGTEYERLNESVETFAALTYLMPGVPLMYNGQEYDLNKRLKFFEKDEIPHNEGKMMKVYQKLGKLKATSDALHGGINKASYKRISTSNDNEILAFEREKNGKKVIFIANLSSHQSSFYFNEFSGKYNDYMNQEAYEFSKGKDISLKPWEYLIFVK